MVYNFKEILEKYGTRSALNKALEVQEIYKLEYGVYSDRKNVDPLVLFSKRYPDAVITMDSAFYFYNLTDVIPNKVCLATNDKAHTIINEKILQFFMSKDILYQGKVEIEAQDGIINIYDKERLLVEFVRKRSTLPFDYYKEIVANYREISGELDMYKIEEYLSLFKNEVGIFDIMQREIF